MLLYELRLTVVGDLCKLARESRSAHVLDRRSRQADDLPVVVSELLELAQPQIEVGDRRHASDPVADIARGRRVRQSREPLRVLRWEEMRERVDLHELLLVRGRADDDRSGPTPATSISACPQPSRG